MIELHGQAGLPYVNRNAYSGSFRGMRYRLKKKAAEEGTSLEAEEEKTYREFPFTQEGFDEAVAWLNEEYERQKERWEQG